MPCWGLGSKATCTLPVKPERGWEVVLTRNSEEMVYLTVLSSDTEGFKFLFPLSQAQEPQDKFFSPQPFGNLLLLLWSSDTVWLLSKNLWWSNSKSVFGKNACQWSPSESFTGKAQLFDQTYTVTFAPARSLYQKGRCTLLDDRELGNHGSKTEQVQVETRFKDWIKTCLVVPLLMRYIVDSIRHIQSLRTAMVLMPWNKASVNSKPPAQATASSCLPGEIQGQPGLSSGSDTGRSRAWEKKLGSTEKHLEFGWVKNWTLQCHPCCSCLFDISKASTNYMVGERTIHPKLRM